MVDKLVFAEWLRERMDTREPPIGVNALGYRVGVSGVTVGRWLKGTKPEPANCIAIAKFFGVPARSVLEMAGYPADLAPLNLAPAPELEIMGYLLDKMGEDRKKTIIEIAQGFADQHQRELEAEERERRERGEPGAE